MTQNRSQHIFPGRIILFFEHKSILLGVCIAQTSHHLTVLTQDGKTLSLNPSRVVLASCDVLNPNLSEEELVKMLRIRHDQQSLLQHSVVPGSLWSQACGSERIFSLAELARMVFQTEPDFDRQCAIIRALVADAVYFKVHGSQARPRTPAEVEARHLKARQEEERQKIVREGSVWLSSVVHGIDTSSPVRKTCIDILKHVAVHGKESDTYRSFRDMLAHAGITDQKQCFDILVRLGIWDEDENLLPERYGLPRQWPDEIAGMAESMAAERLQTSLTDPERVDLTGLNIFSIDDPFTRDVDDALSIAFEGHDTVLGVHIADVASLVPEESDIDLEAARRGTTIYFPEGKIPLLPQPFSENAASLGQGTERPALSFFIRLSRDGYIQNIRCMPSVVKVTRRFSYDEADRAIEDGSELAALYGCAAALRKRRIALGAILLPVPELYVRVDAQKNITTRLRDKETPAQVLVSECMILANYCAALQFKEHACPAIFRRQTVHLERPFSSETLSPADLYLLRRRLNRVLITTSPGRHTTLGLPCYLTLTSPIRKYMDLVNQRQLSCLVRNKNLCYSKERLQNLLESLRPVLARATLVTQERRKYWVLKILRTCTGKPFEALVLGLTRRGCMLLLKEYLLEIETRDMGGKKLAAGDSVSVILNNIDPFYGTVSASIIS